MSTDATRIAQASAFDEILIVAPGFEDFDTGNAAVRLNTSIAVLPSGTYWFSGAGLNSLLQVVTGAPAGASERHLSSDVSEGSPLASAADWFEHLWNASAPVPAALYEVGGDVIMRASGQDGIIRSRQYAQAGWRYRVFAAGGLSWLREADISRRPSSDDASAWVQLKPESPARFAATLTRAKLNMNFRDTLYSYSATRTVFRPYQFKPVLKLLNTDTLRLLIADEVGLGKTIEAGLVWTELEARRQADRVLVVCPSSLVSKWKREMEERFSVELTELTSDRLSEVNERLERGTLPARRAYICSIERLRTWDGLEQANDLGLQFDLVIVDEAHSFRNSETRSHELGELLSEWADAFVMLSATPVNLRNRDLFNLLGLLVPGEFEDLESLEERLAPNSALNRITESLTDPAVTNVDRLGWLEAVRSEIFGAALAERPDFELLREVLLRHELDATAAAQVKRLCAELHALSGQVTRTRKMDVQEFKALRKPVPIPVEWTDKENEFYEAFRQWCVDRAESVDMPLHFAMQMPLRLAGSCLPEAASSVLEWWHGKESVLSEPDDEPVGSSAFQLGSASPAVAPSARLVDLAKGLREDTKFDQFKIAIDSLVSQGRQALVFTFSRRTLRYLHHRLENDARVAVLMGSVPRRDRDRIMADFRAGKYQVLIATKVASEGLDFEFCSAVVNYDLPWNPMEIEQRIGRIDRIGQEDAALAIYNFYTPGTIETDILMAVFDRIQIFTHAIGHLEPILESQWPAVQKLLFEPNLTPQQRAQRERDAALALEEQALSLKDVETAAPMLVSSDGVEIDGLDGELQASGRYVGQQELALLIEDWAGTRGGTVERDSTVLRLRGNMEMAEEVQALVRTGERASHEVNHILAAMRGDQWVTVSIDHEVARTSGLELLTANHPLTRAALQIPGHRQARYTVLEMTSEGSGLEPGEYLAVLATAEWAGVRPLREVWSAGVDLSSRTPTGPGLGQAVLAELARGALKPGPWIVDRDLNDVVALAEMYLANDGNDRVTDLERENAAFLSMRRTSYEQVHERRMKTLREQLETNRARKRAKGVRLTESRISKQRARFEAQAEDLVRADNPSLEMRDLAACLVVVRG
ncbi:DEAD/DEAH box helicase [Aeromicrobium yanjiei]|uniref:DEAD/DEAH box helicase n=1 Tax=Aeromicrobium yanjiei TaxID=2662028 RepID=UPI00188E8D83|nr:helicase-related protein [Aeromicrobium yanjiei]